MDFKNTSIGAVTRANYRTAAVFKKWGLDYCCEGEITLSAACEAQELSPEKVIAELQQAMLTPAEEQHAYDNWPLDVLATHIQQKHHKYVEEAIPELTDLINKIVQAHGKTNPELVEIASIFKKTSGELSMHMKKEELMIFPYIKKLLRLREEGITEWKKPVYGTVGNPIRQMLGEHDAEGKRMKEIARLSLGYTPPADACNTYQIAYQKLREFEEDLYLHIHLENNILFPKAIEMEQQLEVGA